MNGMAKAGGILSIIAAAFGILGAVIVILFGGLFSSVDVDGTEAVGAVFIILGIIIMVISILMILWSSQYMKDGSKKILLVVLSIICAVLSIGSWISLVLYILAAVFIALGKEEQK